MSRLVFGSLVLAAFAFAQEKDKKADPEPKPDAPPKADVRGKVENVYGVKVRGLVGAMLVKGAKEKDTEYDQASVSVLSTAKVYRWVKGKKVDAKFGDIKKGDRVQATFTGPVAESFPVQAKASEVIILEAPKEDK